MPDDDHCEHYEEQVGIEVAEIHATEEDEIKRYCDWCGDLPDILLRKSSRYELLLCEECRTVIRILAQSSDQANADE